MKKRRNFFDKLKTFLFWKDTRVTAGDPYTEIREYDFSSYYPEDDYIKKAAIPKENIFDIRKFGAIPNDPDIDNAPFINKAFEKAESVGGTVLIAGGDYTSTTVFPRSNTTLFIERGSAIIANETGIGYTNMALLYGENLESITFTGGGKIKGNGHLFGRRPVFDSNVTEPAEYVDVIEMRQDYRKQLRFAHESKYGSPIVLKSCNNVSVYNFIIENSAYWTFRLDKCNNIDIHDFIINNNRNVANADGIDLMGSSNVKIRHCFISTADDGIVIKNALWEGCDAPMKNIDISDCEVISRTNAIKVGTETTHNISHITISDCKLFMTDLYPGCVCAISLEAVDGSVLSDVTIKNIIADRCSCPVFIRLGNRNRAAEVNSQSARAIEFGKKAEKGGSANKKQYNHKSEIKNISVDNLIADEVEIPVMICGYRQGIKTKRVKNVALNNIRLTFTQRPFIIDRRLFIPEYAKEYPESNRFRNLPSYALFIRHAENIRISDFKFNKPKTNKKAVYKRDAVNYESDV